MRIITNRRLFMCAILFISLVNLYPWHLVYKRRRLQEEFDADTDNNAKHKPATPKNRRRMPPHIARSHGGGGGDDLRHHGDVSSKKKADTNTTHRRADTPPSSSSVRVLRDTRQAMTPVASASPLGQFVVRDSKPKPLPPAAPANADALSRVVCKHTEARNYSYVDAKKKAAMDKFVPRELREVVRDPSHPRARRAFVTMVSNHRYVDGALVLAHTLRKRSPMVQSGDVDIVALVNEKLRAEVLDLFAAAGFDYVKVMSTLAVLSPRSYYTFTFDKMYLFYLTEYDTVIFMDADFICTKNPDSAWDSTFSDNKGAYGIKAVGSPGSDYFQTAFVVLRPRLDVFAELLEEYKYSAFNYNQWRARDGILLRNCFKRQHAPVVSDPDPRFLHHFYGFFKPWFDKDRPPKRSEKQLPFDPLYRVWWENYEELHFNALAHVSIDPATTPRYGGRRAADVIGGGGASRYFWLQRYSTMEYVRMPRRVWARETNYTLPSLRLVLSGEGESCTASCRATSGLVCREDLLNASSVNSCAALNATLMTVGLSCGRCSRDGNGQQYPAARQFGRLSAASHDCVENTMYDARRRSTCGTIAPGDRRLCPCVAPAELHSTLSLKVRL